MTLVVWRDSVAAGDDADAPHEWTVPGERGTPIGTIVETLLRARYLASIAGGRATWIVEGVRPLAVVAQQWTTARWLVPPETVVATVARPERPPDLQLRYWCQVDPDRVFECLRSGAPLPDRYGR